MARTEPTLDLAQVRTASRRPRCHLPRLKELVQHSPARRIASEQGELTQGLPVRLKLQRERAAAEIDLGDEGRIWPSDEALARWRAAAPSGVAEIVYE